MKIVKIPKR